MLRSSRRRLRHSLPDQRNINAILTDATETTWPEKIKRLLDCCDEEWLGWAECVDTGFIVVVKLNEQGYSDGIYIVADSEDTKGATMPQFMQGEEKFAWGRIGPLFGEMAYGRELDLTDVEMGPMEIVWTERSRGDDVIRAVVPPSD